MTPRPDLNAVKAERAAALAVYNQAEARLADGQRAADVRDALVALGHSPKAVEKAISALTNPDTGTVGERVVTGELIIPLPSNSTPIIESAKTIFPLLADRRTAFWRGGRVCEVIEADGQTAIDPLRPEAFRSRIESLGMVGAWVKTEKGKSAFSPKRASREDCVALLATREAAEILPPIESVYASPVIVLDGGRVYRLGKGYHRTGGGALVTGGAEIAPVVSPVDAAAMLDALLVDFQFATPGDRTRALAAIITPSLCFGRFVRGPLPIFVAEADKSQTGKGYLCQTITKLYGEVASVVAQRTGGVGGFDESVQERMVTGRPFIFIDNLRGHVDSQFIEATLTAGGRIGCRIPHKGEIHVDASRFIFMATSNGIKSTTDFANRACISRMRKQSHGHTWHPWPEGGLWEHVEANAARYQAAVHSLVEAWHNAGAPRVNGQDHDFRDWAGTVAAIINLAWPNAAPLMEGHREAQERTANPALSWLREVALAVAEDGRSGEELSATAIAELCATRDIEIPGLRDATDEAKAAKLVGYTMRRCLGDAGVATIEGHTVQAVEVMVARDDGKGSFAAKRYVFVTATGVHSPSHSSHSSKTPITPKEPSCSLESINPLLGVTGEASPEPPTPDLWDSLPPPE